MSRINLKVVTRINLPILRFNALNASRSLLVIFTAHSIQSIRIHVIRVKTKYILTWWYRAHFIKDFTVNVYGVHKSNNIREFRVIHNARSSRALPEATSVISPDAGARAENLTLLTHWTKTTSLVSSGRTAESGQWSSGASVIMFAHFAKKWILLMKHRLRLMWRNAITYSPMKLIHSWLLLSDL